MAELIWAIVCGILSVVCLIISIFQFREKGYIFNNAYIWASKQEREKLDQKPCYRQSGIAFALCAAILLVMAMECVLSTGWLWLLVGALSAALLVYAVSSSATWQENVKK